MIQILKCTLNSNFKMEVEFENVPRSKVVEFEKLNNFHFLEIFNFFRKFLSNLKNRLSGSSVNNAKFKNYIAAHRRRHAVCLPPTFFAAFTRGNTPMSPWRTRPCAGDVGRLLPGYK